jgi:hypothetical protein
MHSERLHRHESEMIRLRNLFLDCNQLMRVGCDPHTLHTAKCNLQDIFTNPAFSKSGADLLSSYGVRSVDKVDDAVLERLFCDPREELLKWIARELHKVSNVNCLKRLRADGDDDRQNATEVLKENHSKRFKKLSLHDNAEVSGNCHKRQRTLLLHGMDER